jgi:hypothetical protein
MNKEDIIRMAREAGAMPVVELAGCWITYDEPFQRFAALVAAAEREACAKVVENHALGYAEPVWAFKLIDTIRARGNQ